MAEHLVYLYGVLAACLLGTGFVLQQRAARHAPLRDLLRFRLLLHLLREPVWLAGIGCMVAGQIFSVLALAHGEVSRVVPILATNLLFAMALAHWWSKESLGVSGAVGAILLSGGVVAFILAGSPEGNAAGTGPTGRWIVFGGLLALALALVTVARRSPLVRAPPMLATAAGILYGIQDALTRAGTTLYSHGGVTRLLASWQPYALVTVAVTGLLLAQSAFKTGLLRSSLPALTAAEPLAGILCGIGFLGDGLRTTEGAVAWEVTGLLAIVVGVVLLGRHPALPTGPDEPAPPPDTSPGG